MKQSVSLLLAGMVLAQSVVSYAQNANVAPAIPVVGGTGAGGTMIFGPSGNQRLDQSIIDNTKTIKDLVDQNRAIQDIDRQYLISVVERLNGHLNALAELKLKFTQLSQSPITTGKNVRLADYLVLVNEINNRDQVLRNEIQTQTLITRESLPSYDSVNVGGVNASVATAGNVNLKPVMERIEIARASLIADMNDKVKFTNMEANFNQSASITENALSPVLTGLRVLSDSELEEKKKVASNNMVLKPETQGYAAKFGNLSVTQINNFLKNHVSNEYLRFQNVNDKTSREKVFGEIAEGFFMRSYLRRKFNVRLGAIRTITFDKNLANTEDFTKQPMLLVLKSLEREVAEAQPDVLTAYEDVRNWVEHYDKKLTPVFVSKEEIMKNPEKMREYASQNTGVLVRANSAINTITGQDNAAEALLMIMRLILADTTEEMMLFSADPAAMVNYHNARYRSNDAQKATYVARACGMDFTLSQADANTICKGKVPPMPQIQGGRSFREVFAGLALQMHTVEKARRTEAANAMKLIAADLQAQGNDPSTSEVSDMFK